MGISFFYVPEVACILPQRDVTFFCDNLRGKSIFEREEFLWSAEALAVSAVVAAFAALAVVSKAVI